MSIKIKIKDVYLPFFVVSVVTILYNLFRLAFDNKLVKLPFKDYFFNFFIPFAFPWIPIESWLGMIISQISLINKIQATNKL
jgi:rhomboid protease GluP